MKPNWKDAPEWANCLAMDGDGIGMRSSRNHYLVTGLGTHHLGAATLKSQSTGITLSKQGRNHEKVR